MSAGIAGGYLYIGEDNLVRWGHPEIKESGLYDEVLGSFVNDATVVFTLKDAANAAVSGATAVSMTYVTGSNGCYAGTLEDGVALTSGSTYYLEVTATGSSDRVGFRRITYLAQYHGAD